MATENFQAPKGTRDFYPEDMAVRRYIEDIWRRVSVRHGFQEVDGPTFESLDLYKVKSGEEIVSQLFSFTDRGGRDLALRPEFTPTLARMVAQRGAGLPRPIKWFSIARCYRAEQPQKGRLREFMQWNVDYIGDTSDRAERECLALCVDALREFGLDDADFHVGWNHREWLNRLLTSTFVSPDRRGAAYYILDRLHKYDRKALYSEQKCSDGEREWFDFIADTKNQSLAELTDLLIQKKSSGGAPERSQTAALSSEIYSTVREFEKRLKDNGLGAMCRFDLSIVRGLAYYTGFVFEVSDRQGENRAIAGGGRYDNLIKMFGGPSLGAVGFGMGDVVLEILLRQRNKLPGAILDNHRNPDVFIVNALEDTTCAESLIFQLRRSQWDAARARIEHPGLYAACSYRSTRNIGKLLQEAAASGAKLAVILAPAEFQQGLAKLKNLAERTEREIPLASLVAEIRQRCPAGPALSRPPSG